MHLPLMQVFWSYCKLSISLSLSLFFSVISGLQGMLGSISSWNWEIQKLVPGAVQENSEHWTLLDILTLPPQGEAGSWDFSPAIPQRTRGRRYGGGRLVQTLAFVLSFLTWCFSLSALRFRQDRNQSPKSPLKSLHVGCMFQSSASFPTEKPGAQDFFYSHLAALSLRWDYGGRWGCREGHEFSCWN